jgi:hypothetical protein
MQAIFWLMLYMPGGHPVHVGNYPDMASCVAAANASQSARVAPGGGGGTGSGGGVLRDFICVQANSGKLGDPGPPVEWGTLSK